MWPHNHECVSGRNDTNMSVYKPTILLYVLD